jgi:hypothetical protein
MGRRARRRAHDEPSAPEAGARAAAAPRASRVDRTKLGRRAAGRPRAPWHPVPLSEIAIGVGLVLFLAGFAQGKDGSLLIGLGVLMATGGVVELCAREHFAGYRSHVLLLAFLPVVAVHTVLRLWVAHAWAGPASLLVDAAVFAALAMVLLDRYRRAERR